MLTIKDIKNEAGIYDIPADIHINKNVCFDFRLFDALVNPDYENNHDYKYDFDIYLPKYGINLQRPYVWEACQQQEFIFSILLEKPIDSVIINQHNSDVNRSNTINRIIDGKQRLLTIRKFGLNEFPIFIDGKEYYYKDFSKELQFFFRSRVNYMTGTVYYSYDDIPLDDDMLIRLFNFYNFAGTPQAEAHKNKLQNLLKH